MKRCLELPRTLIKSACYVAVEGGAADDADILANHAKFNFEFVITWLQRLGKLIGTDIGPYHGGA